MKDMKMILKLSVTLLLICTFVAGALAGVNAITEDRIAALLAEKTQKALAEVLPGAGELTVVDFADESGIVKTVYAAAGKGYAIEVAPAGFGGAITMMVGVDESCKVIGISIVSHTETASLGAVAADKGSAGVSFREQFKGQTLGMAVGQQIDAITGATITSKAVTDGVNAALAAAEQLIKGGAAK